MPLLWTQRKRQPAAERRVLMTLYGTHKAVQGHLEEESKVSLFHLQRDLCKENELRSISHAGTTPLHAIPVATNRKGFLFRLQCTQFVKDGFFLLSKKPPGKTPFEFAWSSVWSWQEKQKRIEGRWQ